MKMRRMRIRRRLMDTGTLRAQGQMLIGRDSPNTTPTIKSSHG